MPQLHRVTNANAYPCHHCFIFLNLPSPEEPSNRRTTISRNSQDQAHINISNKRTNHLFKVQNSEVQTKYLRNNKSRNVNTYRKYTNCTNLTTHCSSQKMVRSRKTNPCPIVLFSDSSLEVEYYCERLNKISFSRIMLQVNLARILINVVKPEKTFLIESSYTIKFSMALSKR